MAFHTHSGWEWSRHADGSVEIVRRNPVGNVLERHLLTAEQWASVVCSVSLQGETGGRHCDTLEFHNFPQV